MAKIVMVEVETENRRCSDIQGLSISVHNCVRTFVQSERGGISHHRILEPLSRFLLGRSICLVAWYTHTREGKCKQPQHEAGRSTLEVSCSSLIY